MDQFLNFILENIPALSAVATVIAGFISVVAKLKDNTKEVSAEVKKTLDSQKELAEQNEKLNEVNIELANKLAELKTLVNEVVELKAEVENLNATNTKLASTVRSSVKYEIEKEKQTIANLENDKKRLGGM